MKSFALLIGLSFLLGCHPPSASSTPVPPALTGQPSWFPLGGEVYHEQDVERAEKTELKFKPEARWFDSFQRRATTQEFEAYRAEQQRRGNRSSVQEPSSAYPRSLPGDPRYPLTLTDLPTDDRGVRLSFNTATTDDPAILQFSLTLSSKNFAVNREVEHRWTNVLPLLFAFYVDGKAVNIPCGSFGKEGGAKYDIPLVPAGGSRNWQLRVNEASLHQFLTDNKPHRVEIACAFSERQHQGWMDGGQREMDGEQALSPGNHDAPQILVRSNVSKLEWTGSSWRLHGQ